MGDAGIVDDDVEAAESTAGGAEESVDGMGIADVTRVGEDFCGGQFPADFFQGGLVASRED